jgi:hypothetical protein
MNNNQPQKYPEYAAGLVISSILPYARTRKLTIGPTCCIANGIQLANPASIMPQGPRLAHQCDELLILQRMHRVVQHPQRFDMRPVVTPAHDIKGALGLPDRGGLVQHGVRHADGVVAPGDELPGIIVAIRGRRRDRVVGIAHRGGHGRVDDVDHVHRAAVELLIRRQVVQAGVPGVGLAWAEPSIAYYARFGRRGSWNG